MMQPAIFLALGAAFGALVWGFKKNPDRTFLLVSVLMALVFFWFMAGHLAERFA